MVSLLDRSLASVDRLIGGTNAGKDRKAPGWCMDVHAFNAHLHLALQEPTYCRSLVENPAFSSKLKSLVMS